MRDAFRRAWLAMYALALGFPHPRPPFFDSELSVLAMLARRAEPEDLDKSALGASCYGAYVKTSPFGNVVQS